MQKKKYPYLQLKQSTIIAPLGCSERFSRDLNSEIPFLRTDFLLPNYTEQYGITCYYIEKDTAQCSHRDRNKGKLVIPCSSWLGHHSKNWENKAGRDLALKQTEQFTWRGRRGQARRRPTRRRTWGQTWGGPWGRARWSPRRRARW